MNLPRPSDLSDSQKDAILSAGDDGRLSGLTPRVTLRALHQRHLITRVDPYQSTIAPARLTTDGEVMRAQLQDYMAARRTRRSR